MSDRRSTGEAMLCIFFIAAGCLLLSRACSSDANGGTPSVTAKVEVLDKNEQPVKAKVSAWSVDTWLPDEWMESPKQIPQDNRPIPTWAEATQNKATNFIDMCAKHKDYRANVEQNYRKMSVHYALLPIDHPDKDREQRRLLLEWMIINGKLDLDDPRLYPGSADKEERARMKSFRHTNKRIGID